jgi:hypothetical protein
MVSAVYLYPLSGSFDVEEIRRMIEIEPTVLLDPCGSGTYMICRTYGRRPSRRLEATSRISDPTRFQYTVGLIVVTAEKVMVHHEYADEAGRASAREIVTRVLERYRCRVLDDYNDDFTDRVAQHGPDVLYRSRLA